MTTDNEDSLQIRTAKLTQASGLPFEGVACSVEYTRQGVQSIALTLNSKRTAELKLALNQALNTRAEAPPWLFALADALDAALPVLQSD